MTNMDPVMESIFTKTIPCPGVGILKMIACSAARPRMEKFMSTPRGEGLAQISDFSILHKLSLKVTLLFAPVSSELPLCKTTLRKKTINFSNTIRSMKNR